MKESAQAAMSFVRSNYEELMIPPETFDNTEVHIHVPSGATPKDGPSAGITMAVALASLFTRRPVKPCLAMTGEITLRGELLPIGGLKEKLLAAVRSGVEMVMLPADNKKDMADIPKEIKSQLKTKFFSDMMSGIKFALGDTGKPGAKGTRRSKKSGCK
jgi:ATP-dependent Lon protease